MPKQRANGQGSIYQRKDGLWTAAATVDGKKIFAYGKTPEIAWGKLQDKAGVTLGKMPLVETGKKVTTTKTFKTEDQFYRIPKALFGSKYKLNSDAKVLYSLLLDKGDGEVSREELAGILNLSRPTITKTCQQLTKAGLIREVRQGQNKPNIIHTC
jgi:biotin operon repressor